MRRFCVGIDFGGTGTRIVVCEGELVRASKSLTTAELGTGEISGRVTRLSSLLTDLLPHGSGLKAIGIGATGPVDRTTGIIHNQDTLPWFSDFPLASMLEEKFNVPIVMDNDAVVAAIAEYRLGAAKGNERVLMVALGTGIGVAFLDKGRPFRGPNGAHPEAGHITIQPDGPLCYCGTVGCWEQLASRKALQASLRGLMSQDICERDLIPAAIEAARVSPAIQRELTQYGFNLGRGLSVLQTLYMPDVTVIGGNIAQYLASFGSEFKNSLERRPPFDNSTEVRIASMGDEAGAIGAALMASYAPD